MQIMDLFFDDLLESSSDDEDIILTLLSNILESSSDDESNTSSIYDNPENEDGIDFLSKLPDSIICQIISKLQTKEAVQTTLLSSRYKSLWKNITSLRFNYCDFGGDAVILAHFVNMVLIFLKSKSISEFCLILETPCHLYDIPTWLSAAIGMNVKVLKLHSEIGCDEVDNDISNPACLYTSKTLEVLEIFGDLSLNVPEFVSLPKLTTLELYNVNYSSDESVRMRRDAFDGVTTFTIYSPTLKTFDYSFLCHNESIQHDFKFVLNAPQLREFYLVDGTSRTFTVSNLCSLEVAQIEVTSSEGDTIDSYYEKVVQLIQGLHNVNHLWISGDALEALSHMPSEETYFWNDVLRMDTNYSEQSSLQDFLDPSTKSHDFYLLKDSADTTHAVRWSAPQELPVCLLSVLETISVSGFKGRKSELSMIVHILKNAKVLKKITISEATSESEANLELYEKILTFDRGSERCEIIFS